MTALTVILFAAVAAISSGSRGSAHDGPIKTQCIECHTRLPLAGADAPLRTETGEICLTCHSRYHGDELGSHPVNLIPSLRVPADMPLDENGKMGCITCHSFHGGYRDDNGKKLYYLRRTPGRDFCFSCHGTL
jgi:predicted CXXCH cytochrome family protein